MRARWAGGTIKRVSPHMQPVPGTSTTFVRHVVCDILQFDDRFVARNPFQSVLEYRAASSGQSSLLIVLLLILDYCITFFCSRSRVRTSCTEYAFWIMYVWADPTLRKNLSLRSLVVRALAFIVAMQRLVLHGPTGARARTKKNLTARGIFRS